MPPPTGHIIHADLDAFYAAVEQLDHPESRGLPVLVEGRPKGRGVVATASCEARRFGIRSAMPMAIAVHRRPAGIIVRPHLDQTRSLFSAINRLDRIRTHIP